MMNALSVHAADVEAYDTLPAILSRGYEEG